jgi:cytochrome b pre-mRNA-processing protein 3
MIFNLFRKPAIAPDLVDQAYASIVAQSRQVKFYADWGVPDTVTGRFDMISLHLALLLHRLKHEESARAFAQAVVELFFKDMDRSVRELGVTDLGVPKKVRKMGEVFYGLAGALDAALDTKDAAAIESVLARNVYDGPNPGARQLAAYVLEQIEALASRSTSELISSREAAA